MSPTLTSRPILRRKAGPLTLLLSPSRGSGLIAANVLLRRGSVDEAPGEHGLSSFTASMLKRGTATRSSQQTAFELESLGAMTGFSGDMDHCGASIRSAAGDFMPALEIFLDCLRNPAFEPGEVETERQATLAHLRRLEDEKFGYTYHHYLKRIFAGHGYGHESEGEKEDVERITPEDCRRWHARAWRPEHMIFAAAGDFDPDALQGALERHVEGWPPSGGTLARCEAKPAPPVGGGPLTLRKKLEQGFIVTGFPAPCLAHPDRPALRLACAVLGEGFAGRLFTRLRDQQSLAYAVGSFLETHRLGGHLALYIGTKPGSIDVAHAGLIEQARLIGAEAPEAADIERAREYVIGKFLMDHQTLGSRAAWLARWEDSGLTAEYDEQYADDLRKVTAEEVAEAARRWWREPVGVILRPE